MPLGRFACAMIERFIPSPPHGLDIAAIVVGKVETLVDPIVSQSLRVIQI